MLLTSTDLAEYIKERHYRQVRSLGFAPKLVDLHASSDPATNAYLKVKGNYAAEIGADFVIERPEATTDSLIAAIKTLNLDPSVHGLIAQMPLPDSVETFKVVSSITPAKDVDGLGPKASYDPATPTGILWLLASYNIEYKTKTVTVVGQGRLVGEPISKMLADSGANVIRCDISTKNLADATLKADIIVSATGQPGLIKPGMVKPATVVIDAAGDVDPELLKNPTLKITPARGGVGPMTVAALFDHLIRAAQLSKA